MTKTFDYIPRLLRWRDTDGKTHSIKEDEIYNSLGPPLAILADPVMGKTTLMDFRLREISKGEETETILDAGTAYLRAIEDKFGIVIDELYEALKPIGGKPAEP